MPWAGHNPFGATQAFMQYTASLLDLGAMGMLFQMCETAEQAEEFVRWARYPPSGQRGAMFGGAHDDYGSETVPNIISGAHDRTMVCVLIESSKGLANAEEIMSVPGVDVAHLGHGDLSLSLEVPGIRSSRNAAGLTLFLTLVTPTVKQLPVLRARSIPVLSGSNEDFVWLATAMTSG